MVNSFQPRPAHRRSEYVMTPKMFRLSLFSANSAIVVTSAHFRSNIQSRGRCYKTTLPRNLRFFDSGELYPSLIFPSEAWALEWAAHTALRCLLCVERLMESAKMFYNMWP
jgi:hypothetical protein